MFGGLKKKNESLVAVDIGESAVKLIELDITGDRPVLVNLGHAVLPEGTFTNNEIKKVEAVSAQLNSILEANGIGDRRVVTAMPGPSVFTKKIQMPQMDIAELVNSIHFEAANFIPHGVNDVKLDFYVLGEGERSQLDVLIVAVKNEIIESYMECFSLSGLELAIVDVDYFAVQNMFELGYPELLNQTVALVNIGSRYTGINICRKGASLFTGDVAIGGRIFTDSIVENMGVSIEDAEKLKRGTFGDAEKQADAQDVIDKNLEYMASELNRQLSFFWNASGADDDIDKIMLTGGGALVNGLIEELSEKTGVNCEFVDSFRGIETGANFDRQYLKDLGPLMSACVGLGLRQPGDKEYPEFM